MRERLWAQGSGSPGVGLGRCVRGSESVSHSLGIGIAYEEPEQRGRGSGTAGGHTGNGQGPRAPALASEGRGGAQCPAPSVPTPGRLRALHCPPASDLTSFDYQIKPLECILISLLASTNQKAKNAIR
ncbi:hypothetical protein STEG23_014172 [Scotinomys teguina]